jgi:hypothetical protein
MTTSLKVLVKGTGAEFAGFANQWQTHWINTTSDLAVARNLIDRWREHHASVSAEHFPDTWQAVITADWAVAKYQVVVDNVFDDDEFPWWQRLGLSTAEVTV